MPLVSRSWAPARDRNNSFIALFPPHVTEHIQAVFTAPTLSEDRRHSWVSSPWGHDRSPGAAAQERLFAMLKSMGGSSRIGGIVLGKHELFDDLGTGRPPADILIEVLDGEGHFPILVDVDCDHTHPMLTLPIGGTAEFDADAQEIRLLDWGRLFPVPAERPVRVPGAGADRLVAMTTVGRGRAYE